jgi:hypothetical protein
MVFLALFEQNGDNFRLVAACGNLCAVYPRTIPFVPDRGGKFILDDKSDSIRETKSTLLQIWGPSSKRVEAGIQSSAEFLLDPRRMVVRRHLQEEVLGL